MEHIFGDMTTAMGGTFVRTIGAARARFKIGMMNLGYNVRRLATLERVQVAWLPSNDKGFYGSQRPWPMVLL